MTPPLPGWESKAETGLIAEPRRAHAAKKFFLGVAPLAALSRARIAIGQVLTGPWVS